MINTRPAIVLAVLTLTALGCGEATLTAQTRSLEGDARPVPEQFQLKQALGTAGRGVIFLNFAGQTIKYGASNSKQNTSWMVPHGSVAPFPSFNADQYGSTRQAAISKVTQWVQHDFRDYDVIVTTERPAKGDYTMVMVGGTPSLIGEAYTTAGIAPYDVGNPNRNDVVFVFSDTLHDLRELATCISHEVGHSFGLDHLEPAQAIMHPVIQPGILAWMNARAHGESRTENQPQILHRLFGAGSGATTPTPVPTAGVDGADFLSQEVPSQLAPGEQFLVKLSFANTGTTTWKTGTYALKAPNAAFGGDTLYIGSDLAPGKQTTYSFYAVAPTQPGTYEFRWTLSRDGQTFGESSTPIVITVGNPVQENRAPIGELEAVSPTLGKGWAYDADAPDFSVWIDIYVDGEYAGSVRADQRRDDLASSGVSGSYHGFVFGMPALGSGSHQIRAAVVDDRGELAYWLPGNFTVSQ